MAQMEGSARHGQVELASEEILRMMNPIAGSAFRGMSAAMMGTEIRGEERGQGSGLDKKTIGTFGRRPLFGQLVQKKGEYGYYLPHWSANVTSLLPIGHEWPKLYADLYGANPGWQRSTSAGMAHFFRNWSGAAKIVYADPNWQRRRKDMKILSDIQKRTKALRDRAKAQGGPQRRFQGFRQLVEED